MVLGLKVIWGGNMVLGFRVKWETRYWGFRVRWETSYRGLSSA